MKKDIRIVVVGDEKTGKTSLIASLVSDMFQEKVPPVIPEVTIPPEVTPERVTIHIIDTSSKPADRTRLDEVLRQADVICLVYAVDRPKTFQNIKTMWLPHFRKLGLKVPVLLVGNKIDTRGSDRTNRSLESDVAPIMEEYKEVETCIECSAKELLNIHEIFQFAQKAVLYPTATLYDSATNDLNQDCVRALGRIFRLCDRDKDGFLDDYELNAFQRRCFGTPLAPEELAGVKEVVHDNIGSEGLDPQRGLTLRGFIYLHHLFIQRGKLETTWTVLREFGYNDDLQLREDYLLPEFEEKIDTRTHATELSRSGEKFLSELFRAHDRDGDGALSTSELGDLFETAIPPRQNPWGRAFLESVPVSADSTRGALNLSAFLGLWHQLALADYKTAVRYLSYLGFEGDRRSAIRVTPRWVSPSAASAANGSENKKKSGSSATARRNAFVCYLLGPAGAGKSALLDAFLGKEPGDIHKTTQTPRCAVNRITTAGGDSHKYLVMHEFGPEGADVVRSRDRLSLADVVAIVYDATSAESAAEAAKLADSVRSTAGPKMPIVFLGNKSDQKSAAALASASATAALPEDICRRDGVAPPIAVSVRDNPEQAVQSIIGAAMDPAKYAPESGEHRGVAAWKVVMGIGAALMASGLMYLGYRMVESPQTRTSSTSSQQPPAVGSTQVKKH